MKNPEIVKDFRVKYMTREQEQTGTIKLFLYETSDGSGIFYGFLEEDKMKRFNMLSQSIGITEAYIHGTGKKKEDAEARFFERVDRYLEELGAEKINDPADMDSQQTTKISTQ